MTTADPTTPISTTSTTSHASPEAAPRRQIVQFGFYKLDPEFRRLDSATKHAAKQEFLTAAGQKYEELICLSYSTVGLKADVDFLFWRIAYSSDTLQSQSAALNRTVLGSYLTTPVSFLSMTKRSLYMDPSDPFHDVESRTRLIPGKRKYLFVYPFVKSRPWYLLPMDERQKIMEEHIKMGNKYPSVKLNTTYSFGVDDQDFVVAFETNEMKDFLDLVQDLRETESSRYTVRDTPMYTAVRTPLEDILGQLF